MKRIQQWERTDRDITNALLNLMEHQTLEKIAVQDILEEAMVNRSTFYQHFPDKYAVLEKLQDNYVTGMTRQIDALAKEKTWDIPAASSTLCEYIVHHRQKMRQILAVRSENLDMEGRMKELLVRYLKEAGTKLTPLEREILSGTMVNFLIHFINSDETGEELPNLMLETWLNMSTYFFRVEDVPDAKKRILDVIGLMHRESI